MPYYSKDPKRDPNFDNHPYVGALSPKTQVVKSPPRNSFERRSLTGVSLDGLDQERNLFKGPGLGSRVLAPGILKVYGVGAIVSRGWVMLCLGFRFNYLPVIGARMALSNRVTRNLQREYESSGEEVQPATCNTMSMNHVQNN